MNYTIDESKESPVALFELNANEEILIERGSMVYHCGNVKLDGQLNNAGKTGVGGMFSAIGRSMTSGQSVFITKVTGLKNGAQIAVAPCIPGKIKELRAQEGNQLYINDGAFLACGDGVNYEMISQSLDKALLGTGGFFVMRTTGNGPILIHACGDILEIELHNSQGFVVDNDRALAWSDSLKYSIKVASGLLGIKSGEGFVNEYTGSGKIYIQTRNLKSVIKQLAAGTK